jgi:CRISPR/Cas system CMR-associated protein Cmr5 small subunit
MDKNPVISDTYIPHKDAEMTELIMVRVTPYEKEFFQTLAFILSKLDIDGKDTKVIKDNSLSNFVRMSLSVVSNFYMSNIFPDSRVMSKLMSNKAKKEFIAFRTKYMNISNEFSS